ncbi:hypothetical protein JCM15519_33120 [Fundidesulfovibrio butyratiphilus]
MILRLSASCTVEDAEQLRQSLLEALARDAETTLDFHDVREVDMSFFQVLVSAQRSFARAGKPLTFTATLDPNVAKKARQAGIVALAALEEQDQALENSGEDDECLADEEDERQIEVAL